MKRVVSKDLGVEIFPKTRIQGPSLDKFEGAGAVRLSLRAQEKRRIHVQFFEGMRE